MSGRRLAAGGWIDRTQPLRFEFDGQQLTGFAGDTLASALIAAGVDIVGRSVNLGRPRGILTAGSEEPNALVAIGWAPEVEFVRATEVQLVDGLVGRSLAGKGPVPAGGGERGDRRHAHCDVLVVGGGPAGLSAALAAGRSGARVIVVERQAELGGSLLSAPETIAGRRARDWVADVSRELEALPEVRVLTRAAATGRYDGNLVLVAQQRPTPGSRRTHDSADAAAAPATQRLWHVRARSVVVATGAIERPIVFADNDRPGIMLAGAVRTYLHRFGVAAGRSAVVFTNNDSAYATALELRRAGVTVAAVVDARPAGSLWTEAARAAGIDTLTGHVVAAAHGEPVLDAVTVQSLQGQGKTPSRRIACDLLAVSGGWNPAHQLYSFPGGSLRHEPAIAAFVPGTDVAGVLVAGAASGQFTLANCLTGGDLAGRHAAMDAGFRSSGGEAGTVSIPDAIADADSDADPDASADPGEILPLWFVPAAAGESTDHHFVDFQRDATVANIELAIAAGLRYPEHIKRFTTIGTGNDQGRTSAVNEVGIIAELLDLPIADLSPTAFRPPVTPIPYGLMAGRERGDLFDPIRPTPAHESHAALGALFENVGQWKRAWAYPNPGESFEAAVARECLAVREVVGIMDVSTLGKIDVQGPDAGAFLDRIYTNQFSTLKVGSARYGLLCRLDGMVFDDGTTTRLSEDRFYMTTTTGNAAAVADWLDEWGQTEWPEMRVRFTSVTDQRAAVAIAGPRSRALLGRLAPALDVSAAAFPFMTVREADVAGIRARIFRISFSGELAYEVNVPSWYGRSLWDAILAAGRDLRVTPYGTEAMHVLRAEKGYVIVGQETDGTVTPLDLGLDWMLSKEKWYIGRRSLARPAMLDPNRRQLVGLLPVDPELHVPEGVALVLDRAAQPRGGTAGHVTSSYRSPTLGRTFAMGLLRGGRERIGTTVEAELLDGRRVPLQVTAPVFYDLENARRDG